MQMEDSFLLGKQKQKSLQSPNSSHGTQPGMKMESMHIARETACNSQTIRIFTISVFRKFTICRKRRGIF